ncbi:AMP-dependent synthetase/ligase [Mycolicibacterium llatzerense]|uniref:AMP-dependent synthetase/ligase n=1 Tax=Mycolicibacterium llatzerense TaxID=280871 RepID=UPI0008DDB920|nr:long-chain fatty acid--CoA ligase [Mycolicibacterium llatzerense]
MSTTPKTLCEAFQLSAAADPDAVALRTVGGTQSITWREYAQRVRNIATGMAGLGIGRGDTVALMLTNRPEFNIVDTAAVHLGAIPFSMYNTNSSEQIAYLLKNSGCRLIICEQQFLERVRGAAGPEHRIIAIDGDTDNLAKLESAGNPGFDFDAAWQSVDSEDVLTLIYTSGTTGNPKGVEITHANVLEQVVTSLVAYGLRRGDRTTSYLPGAHIADRMAAHYVQLIHGTQVTTVTDIRQIVDALPDVRPTYWFAVPRVWDKMKVALEAAFAQQHGPKALLLRRALELGRSSARGEDLGLIDRAQLALLDRIVLSQIRAKLGFDDLRCAMSGAASVSPETLEFFMALGIKLSEVWGMSETAGVATGNPLDRVKVGTVGTALPGVEVRLADDGEVLVRSAIVMRGYRNDPARTAEVLDADGWLRTGDVATIDSDGYVKIVDRKKELIISAGGKNMSPCNIEDTIKSTCPLVGQAVAIGDARAYNTAMIVLDADVAAAYAQKHGIDSAASVLADDPRVVATIADGIAAGNAKLSRVEQIKRFRIVPEFWEPGGIEITPTMKLRRKPIAEKYAAEIAELYEPALVPGVHEPA